MTSVLETRHVTKRFGTRSALSDCTLSIPAGHVVGLVGPNGAGKSTLLKLAAGLLKPTEGSIEVLGRSPGDAPAQLARIGFVGQDHPVYPHMTVRDHLRIGLRLNPRWDEEYALSRINQFKIDLRQRAGNLSGGQRAQLSLTLALAKRPELLLLDEPVASLDPLARRELLTFVMESVTDLHTSVILSSHLVSDLERVCDILVMLVSAHIVLDGDVEEIVTSHHRLLGPSLENEPSLENQEVIDARYTDRQATVIVRSVGPVMDPMWKIEPLSLEDIVLAYMKQSENDTVESESGVDS